MVRIRPRPLRKRGNPGKKYTSVLRVLFTWLPSLPAHIAQSVEHILGKNEVIGSSPIVGSPVFVTDVVSPRARRMQTDEAFIRCAATPWASLRRGCKPVHGVVSPRGDSTTLRATFGPARTQTAWLIGRKESKEAFFQCPRQYLSGQSPM